MLDYVAYLIAQQRTSAVASEALPDAPMREERARSESQSFRYSVGLALHRLADFIAPLPERPSYRHSERSRGI